MQQKHVTAPLTTIILAAGKGSRLYSKIPKWQHKIANFTLLEHVLQKAYALKSQEIIGVFSTENEPNSKFLEKYPDLQIAHQKIVNGTASAALAAEEHVKNSTGVVLIMYCDNPLISVNKLEEAVNKIAKGESDVVLLAFKEERENSYGRFIVEGEKLLGIIETKDRPGECDITLCNSGIVAVRADLIWDLLKTIDCDNIYGEYYLTSIIDSANKAGYMCTYVVEENELAQGVNTKLELSNLEATFQKNKRLEMLNDGVQLTDPGSIFFSLDSKVEPGVTINPHVVLKAGVHIKSYATVESFTHLERCVIEQHAVVGPFARIRGISSVGEGVVVGNFVEVQHSTLGAGSKVKHLAYVGDAEIGEHTNIGAGVVVCNYDGKTKHFTRVGERSFIGSNVSLISPIKLGKNSFIAAGSTITEDVSDNSLAIARAKQVEVKRGKK